MMVPMIPAGRDVSVNCEDNIAPKREAGDETMEEVFEADKNNYHGGSSKQYNPPPKRKKSVHFGNEEKSTAKKDAPQSNNSDREGKHKNSLPGKTELTYVVRKAKVDESN